MRLTFKGEHMKKKIWLLLIPILLILIFSIIYFVKNNNTNPYFFDKKGIILEKDPTKGLTYQDHFNNEWVWIVVPKKIFKTAKNKNDYSHIYNDILNYISDYHNDNYNDDKYLDLRNKTLESIYTYGGFWLSRYEIGNDNGKVVSQKNKYEIKLTILIYYWVFNGI